MCMVSTMGCARRRSSKVAAKPPQRWSTVGVLPSSLVATPSPCFLRHRATFISQTFPTLQSSPFDMKRPSRVPKKRKKRLFIPRKAAVELTDKARNFFQLLLENPPRPDIIGIMLNYDQSKTGEPRMVFSFDFVTPDDITPDDEGVSLQVLEDGSPKLPADSMNDGLPKLYVSHNAFLKVLGAKLDVDTREVEPILYDKEGNLMDPNA